MEDVAEGFLIPFPDLVFEEFKLLLKLMHMGASDRGGTLPPFLKFLLEVQLEEPKFLESEWSAMLDFDIFPFHTYGPMI